MLLNLTENIIPNVHLRELHPNELPWDLLLDADPAKARVEQYVYDSLVLGLMQAETVIGVVVLQQRSPTLGEIMNIAIVPAWQGKKLGKLLLQAAIEKAREWGAKRVELGTGNSSLSQLAFYQKMGFRMQSIEPDYFLQNYPEPIIENGIVCRDRILLALELAPFG